MGTKRTETMIFDLLSTGNGEIGGIFTSKSAAIDSRGARNRDQSEAANTIGVDEDISSGAGDTAVLEELASGASHREGMGGLRAIWVEGSGDIGATRQRSWTSNQGGGYITASVTRDGGSIRINLSIAGNGRDEASLQFGVDVDSLVITRAAADTTGKVAATDRAVEG